MVKVGKCATGSKAVDTTFTLGNTFAGNHGIILMDNYTKANGTAMIKVLTKYFISVSPAYGQEGDTDFTICTNVTGGEKNTVYVANVTVVNPYNSFSEKVDLSNTTTNGYGYNDTLTSITDFSGGHTNVTGTYYVYFNLTATGSLATTSFFIGLTNATSYNRFETVNVKTSGWDPGQNVTVTIKYPNGTVAYTDTANATSGTANWNWSIGASAPLGTYTVTLVNATGELPECKMACPDEQTFEVKAAGVLTVNIVTQPTDKMRTETTFMVFNVTYPDGSLFNATLLDEATVSYTTTQPLSKTSP